MQAGVTPVALDMTVHELCARTHVPAGSLRSLHERRFNPSGPLGTSCLRLVLSRLSYFVPPAAATGQRASSGSILPRGVCSELALPLSHCRRALGTPPSSHFHPYPLALDIPFMSRPLSPLPGISGFTEALPFVQCFSALLQESQCLHWSNSLVHTLNVSNVDPLILRGDARLG